jgi:hypothetical protein
MTEDTSAKLTSRGNARTVPSSTADDGVDVLPTLLARLNNPTTGLTRQLDELTKERDISRQVEPAAALIDQYQSVLSRLLDQAVSPIVTFGDDAEGVCCRMFAALPGLHTQITTSSQAFDAFIVDADDRTVRYRRLDEHDNPSGPALAVRVSEIERVHIY